MVTNDACKSRSPSILTVCCSSQRVFCKGQFASTGLIHITTTNPIRRRPDPTPSPPDGGRRPFGSRPCYSKYPCSVCTRNVTSQGVSYQCNRCPGFLNKVQYRRSSDWACNPCSTPPPIHSPPPTFTPSSDKTTSDDNTFNVLHLNANGICDKLTELRVVMENTQRQSGGDTGVKAHNKIQEPLHPELHHTA